MLQTDRSVRSVKHNGTMNRLSTEKRSQIVGSLVEGNSIRATVRMTGAAKNTVTKLLVDLGAACAVTRTGRCASCPARRSNATRSGPTATRNKRTSQTSMSAPSATATFGRGPPSAPTRSLCLRGSWASGRPNDAWVFMDDLSRQLANRVQLTTDGHKPYLRAVDVAFGEEIDYAML